MTDYGESLFTALGIDDHYDRCIVRVAHHLQVMQCKLPRRWRWVQWHIGKLRFPYKLRFRILERHGFDSVLDDIKWIPSNMLITHRKRVGLPTIRTSKKS